MKPRTLSGKRAIVTGASSGIGRELAVQLAQRGVSLVLIARREAKLKEVRDEILAASAAADRRGATTPPSKAAAHLVAGDICDAPVRQAAVAAADRHYGGLDMLINNAGVSAHGRFEDASPERLRQIMEVNFFAAAELTRSALPLLQEGADPVVVNIGSILGRRGVPFNSDYCASKFALVGWSEAVRPELARHGIDVLLVNPGTTETEFFEHLIEKTGETPWRKTRGVPASKVARATIAAIRRRKCEVIVGGQGRLLLALNRITPGWLNRYLRRYG